MKWKEDYRAVAKAYYHGNRPEIPADCPGLLAKLMVACWQDKQQDRPTSDFMQSLADESKGTGKDKLPETLWLEGYYSNPVT